MVTPYLVGPEELAGALGDVNDGPEVTHVHSMAAEIATGLVLGYTRGRGFDADGHAPQDMRAVALAVALRLVANLGQWTSMTDTDNTGGEESVSGTNTRTGGFKGFTVTEQLVLNRYRRRTA